MLSADIILHFWRENLKEIENKISLKLNADLKGYCTIHIGGNAKFLFEIFTSKQLYKVCIWCIIHNIKYKVIGLGANLIFDDLGYNGAIIVNKSCQILWRKNSAFVSSGMPVSKLIFDAQFRSLSGLENLSGIPATVGGAIYNNLGAFDCSFADCIEYVTCIDTKKLEQKIKANLQIKNKKINSQNLNLQSLNTDKILNEINTIDLTPFKSCITKIKKADCQFAYRDSLFKQAQNRYIILSCKLNLAPANKNEILQIITANIQKKIESQPLDYPSAGSVFKRIYFDENNNNNLNPNTDIKDQNIKGKALAKNYNNPTNVLYPAKIIDELRLKGLSVGGAQISEKHAGFIINTGAATQKDFIKLTDIIKNKIKSRYYLSPQFEVEFVPF